MPKKNQSGRPQSLMQIEAEIQHLPGYSEAMKVFERIKNDPEARKALAVATGIPERYLFEEAPGLPE